MQITQPEQTLIITFLTAIATYLGSNDLGLPSDITVLLTAVVSSLVAYISHSASTPTAPPSQAATAQH